jgi:hypothetical protein
MAFPWSVLRAAPALEGHLVEDLVLGLESTVRGAPPLHAADVAVESELPSGDRALYGQRRRWEHGQLATLAAWGPRLIFGGLFRGKPSRLALGLDLLVPPLSLLVLLLGAAVTVTAAAAALGVSAAPLAVALGALGAVALAVGRSWWSFARGEIPLRSLLAIPLYILWKVPLYLQALAGRGPRRWERTQRKGEVSEEDRTSPPTRSP